MRTFQNNFGCVYQALNLFRLSLSFCGGVSVGFFVLFCFVLFRFFILKNCLEVFVKKSFPKTQMTAQLCSQLGTRTHQMGSSS